jgi:hypothetical protein
VLIAVLVAAAGLALTAPPTASTQQAPAGAVGVTPSVAGKPSTVYLDFDPGSLGSSQGAPRSIVLAILRGFKIDVRSRGARCSDAAAQAFQCPPASRIGSGHAIVNARSFFLPAGGTDLTVSIAAFLARPAAAGDLAAVVLLVSESRTGTRRVLRGRLMRLASGPFAAELSIDVSGIAGTPVGVTLTVRRFQMLVGARRTVRSVKIVRKRVRTRQGTKVRRKRVVRRRRHNLITNPRTCAGTWPYQVRVAFPAQERTLTGAMSCTAAR